jgi:two-component system chemotaxis sensor kinase CheA
VAGATLSGDGSVVLVLDMEDLLTAKDGMGGMVKTSELITI